MPNFSILLAGQAAPASNAAGGAVTEIDAAPAPGVARVDVLIYNPGPATVHVRCGGAGVAADANCNPILAGEKGIWHKGGATHLAAYCASGAQSLVVIVGSGE